MVLEPSLALMLARRTLDHVPGVRLLSDWKWNDATSRWILRCRLSVGVPAPEIPAESDWHVFVSPAYPWGSLKLYPAQENGIRATFPHQSYNGRKDATCPWRSGDVCLSTAVHALRRSGLDTEPFAASERLRWHAERALLWLEAAAAGCLVRPGEPFELPQFPTAGNLTFAGCESSGSRPLWNENTARMGTMELAVLERGARIYVARRFHDLTGLLVHSIPWGHVLDDASLSSEVGLWLRLDAVPVLVPWQAPATWGELRSECLGQGLNLDSLLKRLAVHDREGKSLVLGIGFPIPAYIGAPLVRMHWQAALLPPLTRRGATVRGFRPGEKGYWLNDRVRVLHGGAPIAWIRSENWDKGEITARGRLPEAVTDRKVLLIGAGALGACVGQTLLRAGVMSLTVIDEGMIEIGNLTRHTLSMDHLGRSKAHALADELRKLSPHARVHPICASFPDLKPEDVTHATGCDLILDCTAEDAVIPALEAFVWRSYRPVIASLSLSLGARRLFCFAAPAGEFREEDFRRELAPWLIAQAEEYRDTEMPREGIGCWHPVFPARADDVWLLAAAAVKEIERTLGHEPIKAGLSVIEQTFDTDGGFTGLHRTGTRDEA